MIALWQKAQLEPSNSKIIQFGTPYFATSLATTGLLTLLIVYRILRLSAPIEFLENGSKKGLQINKSRYLNVIEIVVESAALYSLTVLIFLILLVRQSLLYFYPEQLLGAITVKSYL